MKFLAPAIKVLEASSVRPFVVTQRPFPGESLLGFVGRSIADTAVDKLRSGLSLAGIGTYSGEFVLCEMDDEQQIRGLGRGLID